MTTRIQELATAASRLNPAGHELGSPGRRIRITNAGDDPVYWWIAAAEPSGVPGFPIARGGAHEITLPELPLWAWSRGGSRALVTPLGMATDLGIIPGASQAVTLGLTPVSVPTAEDPGANMTLMAAGEPIHLISGTASAPPSPLIPARTLSLGETMPLVVDSDSADSDVWYWTDKHAGADILITPSDGGWSL